MQPNAFVKQSFLSLVKSARPGMGILHKGNSPFGPVTYFLVHFNFLFGPKNHRELSIDYSYNDGISVGTTKHVNDHFYNFYLPPCFFFIREIFQGSVV